ncbi:MAG TPA: hypothetical protein DIC19_01595 [Erysipelotrichaceae bacterium]|nr:hypothetical protein [Erysipelotrichaceae bacterium]
MKRYKTLIFDLGNVLIDFSPYSIVSSYTNDVQIIQTLVREIFLKQEWLDLDQGIMTFEEAKQRILERLDDSLHGLALDILDTWYDHLTERPYFPDLLKELKAIGYRLVLFSNAALCFNDYQDRIQALKYFDYKIISAELKLSKPDAEFYRVACEMLEIDPKSAFFIDDSMANVQAAQAFGIDAFWYNGNFDRLVDYFAKINIF